MLYVQHVGIHKITFHQILFNRVVNVEELKNDDGVILHITLATNKPDNVGLCVPYPGYARLIFGPKCR